MRIVPYDTTMPRWLTRRRMIEIGVGAIAVLGVAAGVVLALQSRDELEAADPLRLNPGDITNVVCDGSSLGINRSDDRSVSLRCYGSPSGRTSADVYILKGGERTNARCSGTRLGTVREGRRELRLSCQPLDDAYAWPVALPQAFAHTAAREG
jgi:hypothetical protein